MYINECWKDTEEALIDHRQLHLRENLIHFYKSGSNLEGCSFGSWISALGRYVFTHELNQHCPACQSLCSVIRSSFPRFRNSKRCFIAKNSEVSSTCITKIHVYYRFLGSNFFNLFTSKENYLSFNVKVIFHWIGIIFILLF